MANNTVPAKVKERVNWPITILLIVGLITNLIVGKRNQDEQNLSENATAEETEEAAVTEAAQESMPE